MDKKTEKKIDLESMSNNELLFQIKQFEVDYEALKIKMLKDCDLLDEIEDNYNKAIQLIQERLKGG